MFVYIYAGCTSKAVNDLSQMWCRVIGMALPLTTCAAAAAAVYALAYTHTHCVAESYEGGRAKGASSGDLTAALISLQPSLPDNHVCTSATLASSGCVDDD